MTVQHVFIPDRSLVKILSRYAGSFNTLCWNALQFKERFLMATNINFIVYEFLQKYNSRHLEFI